MTTKDLLNKYYHRLNQKNDDWQDLWSENAVFSDSSNALVAKGKSQVIQSFTAFLKGMVSVKVKEMLLEGTKACVIASYAYVNSKEEKMNQNVAEMWEIKDDKLSKLTIYFDLTVYRAFMRG